MHFCYFWPLHLTNSNSQFINLQTRLIGFEEVGKGANIYFWNESI